MFCLICLTWLVLEIGSKWLYGFCFVGCCFHDLFYITCSIFVQFPSSFFSMCFVSVHVVHPLSSIDTTITWKEFCFISLDWLDFYMINSLLIAVHIFAWHILTSLSVDETLLLLWTCLLISEDHREHYKIKNGYHYLIPQIWWIIHQICEITSFVYQRISSNDS